MCTSSFLPHSSSFAVLAVTSRPVTSQFTAQPPGYFICCVCSHLVKSLHSAMRQKCEDVQADTFINRHPGPEFALSWDSQIHHTSGKKEWKAARKLHKMLLMSPSFSHMQLWRWLFGPHVSLTISPFPGHVIMLWTQHRPPSLPSSRLTAALLVSA